MPLPAEDARKDWKAGPSSTRRRGARGQILPRRTSGSYARYVPSDARDVRNDGVLFDLSILLQREEDDRGEEHRAGRGPAALAATEDLCPYVDDPCAAEEDDALSTTSTASSLRGEDGGGWEDAWGSDEEAPLPGPPQRRRAGGEGWTRAAWGRRARMEEARQVVFESYMAIAEECYLSE